MDDEPTPPPAEDEPRGITVDELLATITPRAWVTPALAVLILIGFGVETALGVNVMKPTGAELLKAGGQFGPSFAGGEWWRAFSSLFLHAGPLHLAFNLWAFWSVGKLTERIYGNAAFLAIYLLSGVGGSLASLAWSPLSVGVGASGAIFGVYGALLSFMLLHRGVFPPAYLAAQRNSIVGFIGYNVVFGLSQKNTDMAAHAGGLVVGALAGAMLSRELLTPSAHRVRRALGAAGVTALIVFTTFVVRSRLREVPVIKADRESAAANVALEAKHYPEAISLYTSSLSHERTYARLFNRGLAYLGANDMVHAREDMLAADLLESTVRTKGMLCELSVDDDSAPAKLEEAAKYCTAAIQLETEPARKATLLSLRAFVRGKQERIDESLADAEAALALDEQAPRARLRRAVINLNRKKYDEAEADCTKLVTDPDADGFTLYMCSRVAYYRKDSAVERVRLGRALVIAPDDQNSLLGLAWLDMVEGKLPEAIAGYGKALAKDPENAATWNNRAWSEVGIGDFAAARADAERAIALKPDDTTYHGTRCFALVGLGDLTAAREACKQSVAVAHPSAFDVGMLAFIDKRYADARRSWQHASDASPSNARDLQQWMARLPK